MGFAALTVATGIADSDHDRPAHRSRRDGAFALVLDRRARPLDQGAGLRVGRGIVDRLLEGLGDQQSGQSIGQLRDLLLQGRQFGRVADPPYSVTVVFDLLWDRPDLGLDLGQTVGQRLGTRGLRLEASARLGWLTALRHGGCPPSPSGVSGGNDSQKQDRG